MLSIRLNGELERQLEYVAMTQGLSKNQVVAAALEQYLKMQDMGTVPLKDKVQEAGYETFLYYRAEEQKNWPKAALVAEWARKGEIWSARPGNARDGVPTGALYGRNTVVGYVWPENEPIQVLSKYLGPHVSFGVATYRYDLMPLETWEAHMTNFPTATRSV